MKIASGFFLIVLGYIMTLEVSQAAVPLKLDYEVHTKESIVVIQEKKYRVVEYKGEVFYLRMLEVQETSKDLELACGREGKIDIKNQVMISTQMTKRSSLFVEGLKQTCEQIKNGKARVKIDPNIQVGFVVDESQTGLLKNKRIFWDPFKNLWGVGAEW